MVDWRNPPQLIPIGKGKRLKKGKDMALLSIGAIGNSAVKAIARAEEMGISVAHYDMLFLKPIDQEMLSKVAKNSSTSSRWKTE